MPTTDALATPQPNNAPKIPAVAIPTSREDEVAEPTFSPDSDDRWAHMPCTD
jgi:hypothetical protein